MYPNVEKRHFKKILQLQIKEEDIAWSSDPTVAARASFVNAQNATGWMYLEITTNVDMQDEVQAMAAGLLEGYLTR